MAQVPDIRFPRAEHFAFFYEDTHLMNIVFERDRRRLLFLIKQAQDERVELDFPGELFESQVSEAVDRIFFVELNEEGSPQRRLVLGAYFPVENETYGAYYEQGGEERTLFFLRVLGEGDAVNLVAVEDESEHSLVSSFFVERYKGVFEIG